MPIKKYSFNDFKSRMDSLGLTILSSKEQYNPKQKMSVTNGIYKAMIKPETVYYKSNYIEPRWFICSNPYIIENLNAAIKKDNKNIVCLTNFDEYKNRDQLLRFKCLDCGKEFKRSLYKSLNYDSEKDKNGIMCPECCVYQESLHAHVLKQMFRHYYSDTILEERSCINPMTNCIMPTDIVVPSKLLVVEVQSQYHDSDNQKTKDAIKKKFWENKGYKVFTPDIRNYTVLEMCQLFFDIDSFPSWINYIGKNKVDYKTIQKKLNEGNKIQEIAEEMNLNPHIIYDGFVSKKIFYPENYSKSTRVPVVQLTMNREYVNTYSCYAEAERENKIKRGLIANGIFQKSYYACGYYWVPEFLYYSSNFVLPENRLEKFYRKLHMIDEKGIILKTYCDYFEASKDNNIIASKIYESVHRKTRVHGKRFLEVS